MNRLNLIVRLWSCVGPLIKLLARIINGLGIAVHEQICGLTCPFWYMGWAQVVLAQFEPESFIHWHACLVVGRFG